MKQQRMGNLLCCVKVDQGKMATRKRFCSKSEDVLEPGCHWVPWCLGSKITGYCTVTRWERELVRNGANR
ncbi:hypothetical protein C5167_030240 [Papaver somniferum]|nr:hypothetical protein C5167_030240 [Papaver somniferum]